MDNNVGYNAYDSACFCVIKGNVYYDINGNCIKDPGEPGVHHIQIHCSGRGYTYTDDSGNYSFLVPSGTYTITETVLAYYPLSPCQSNDIVVTASAATGCVIPVDFANSINPIHSMHICTWDYNYPIPGHVYDQAIIISNQGTVNEPAILAGYKTDGQFFGSSFMPSGPLGLDSTNWYTTTAGIGLSLAPGVSQLLYADYNVPTFVPLGTSVLFKDSVANIAPMANWLSDYSPWNNVNYFTTTVIGSFDPNFKEVSPKGVGPTGDITYADSILEYMVHFQNTGTYMAENITVIDTLDPNLDWTTLQPIFESAPCKITLNPAGIATFTFSHIDLPAAGSADLPNSNGMFTYSIKTRAGLPLGSQFKNNASIYFDYNAPVKTNTTVNTLVAPVEVGKVTNTYNFFTIYPNPANNTYNLAINSPTPCTAQMEIRDLTGRVLVSRSLSLQQGNQTVSAQTNQIPNGLYFVTINMDGKVQTQKLVVMKN